MSWRSASQPIKVPAPSVSQPPIPTRTAHVWRTTIFNKHIDIKIHFNQTHFLKFDTRFEIRTHFQGNTRRKTYHPREEMGKFSTGKIREKKQKDRQCFFYLWRIFITRCMGAEWREVLVLSETRRYMSFPDHRHWRKRTKNFILYHGNKTKKFFLSEAVFCVYNKSEMVCQFSHFSCTKANRKLGVWV